MAWIYLLIAAGAEIVWAVTLKATDGYTRLLPSAVSLVAMLLSLYVLAIAVRTLPIGTAYTIWTGLGAAGVVLFGVVFMNESASPVRLIAVMLIVCGAFLLRLTEGGGT